MAVKNVKNLHGHTYIHTRSVKKVREGTRAIVAGSILLGKQLPQPAAMGRKVGK